MGSRAWVFTLNVIDPLNEKPVYDELEMKYMKYQLERAPTTGQMHYQGVLRLHRTMRMGAVKVLMKSDKVHLEICKSWQKAKDYVSKEDSAIPGTIEELGEDGAQGERSDLRRVANLVTQRAGMKRIAEEEPVAFLKYHKGIAALSSALNQPPAGERKCILLLGDTGVGKTRFAFDNFKDVYNVFDLKTPWFDGYDGQEVALFDECGPGMMSYNMLKRLTDRYPVTVPVKGGSVPWMAKTIILTSNDVMTTWWPTISEVHYRALDRRIKTFTLPFDKDRLREYMGLQSESLTGSPLLPQAATTMVDLVQDLGNEYGLAAEDLNWYA